MGAGASVDGGNNDNDGLVSRKNNDNNDRILFPCILHNNEEVSTQMVPVVKSTFVANEAEVKAAPFVD
jgi:hypothetical protein